MQVGFVLFITIYCSYRPDCLKCLFWFCNWTSARSRPIDYDQTMCKLGLFL